MLRKIKSFEIYKKRTNSSLNNEKEKIKDKEIEQHLSPLANETLKLKKMYKKNFIIFYLLNITLQGDDKRILQVLKELYYANLLSLDDIFDYKNFIKEKTSPEPYVFNKKFELLKLPKIVNSEVRIEQYTNERSIETNRKKYNNSLIETSHVVTKTPINFIIKELIGKGSFGTVYKVQHFLDEQFYALKKIDLTCNTREEMEYCFNETRILAKLEHENIVRYYTSFLEDESLFLQMELCHQNLHSIIRYSKLSIQKKSFFILQILNGLYYLHEKKYIHYDLKPDNILIKNGVCKIADFGLASLKRNECESPNMGCNIYSPVFLQNCSFFIDIYALGVITMQFFLPRTITEMETFIKLKNKIEQKNYTIILAKCRWKQIIEEFIKKCFQEKTKTIDLINYVRSQSFK